MNTHPSPKNDQLPFPVVGVTGSIASGKTTLTEALALEGAVVIDADVLARELVVPGSDCLNKIIERFGKEIVTNGQLNRSELGRIIFTDPQKRKWLEQLLHPLIRARFTQKLNELKNQHPAPPLVVYVAPLLIEAGIPKAISDVILVTAPANELIKRAVQRGGLTEEQAKQRLASQMPDSEKCLHAMIVIENVGSQEDLKISAKKLFADLTRR